MTVQELMEKTVTAPRVGSKTAAVKPARSRLGAVVCPLVARELPAALSNLRQWSSKVVTGEIATEGTHRPRLVFSFNCGRNGELEKSLREEYASQPKLTSLFSRLDVHFCDLPPEKDVYVRNSPRSASPYGNKSGPNWLFYETMRSLRSDCDFVFLMETDCQPISAGWLQRLDRVCAQNDDAWIIGSHYRGASPLHWTLARHVNGNAIYHIGDPGFWRFLDDFLWPWMLQHITSTDPNLAYDCAWETFLTRPEMEDPGHYDWVLSRQVLDRFRISGAIVNIAGYAEQRGDYIWTKRDVLRRFPGAVVVHGPIVTSTKHLRGGLALGTPRVDGNVVPSASADSLTALASRSQLERSIWLPDRPFEPGLELRVSLGFECPPGHGLKVDLRDPNGRVLASKKAMRQGDKPLSWLGLTHAFSSRHSYVRLFLTAQTTSGETSAVRIAKSLIEISRAGEVIAKTRDVTG